MPYIRYDRREDLETDLTAMSVPGELNYKITLLLTKYMRAKGLNYQTINDIIGALEGAKAEFYRRIAAPYEDQKIKENGDVY
jgi:hypothetical protein